MTFYKGHNIRNTGRTQFKKGCKVNVGRKRKPFSKESIEKMSIAHKGKLAPNYIDGKSNKRAKERDILRKSQEWINLKHAILIRDNFTCQHCGSNLHLNMHHKIPFRLTKDNSMNNLICLCKSCHVKEDDRIIQELKIQGDSN